MADNFSQDQVQGIFGEFKPVIDTSVTPSADNVQGVFGEFVPVLDEAAGAAAGRIMSSLVSGGGLAGSGGIAGQHGGLAG